MHVLLFVVEFGELFYFCHMFNRIFIVLAVLFQLSCNNSDEEIHSKTVKRIATPSKSKGSKTSKVDPLADVPTIINPEKQLLAYAKENLETIAVVHTSLGPIKIKLFEDTPLHRANFVMLAKIGYFNKTRFTRVVKGFIAQGGGTFDGLQTPIKRKLGKYSIPPEIKPKYFHKRGAVAMARGYVNNPDKRSAPFAFYFVEGSKYNKKTLQHYEEQNGYKFTEEQMEYYLNNPGAAHIDGEHTVFGEIIEGIEVLSKITGVKTDSRDWPKKDIFIERIELL